MSNAITDKCRSLQMPPTAKAVLMALADFAGDDGRCWPSISGLCEWTCFGRTAVIDAIKFLESAGVVIADRSNRYRTSYRVIPTVKPGNELVRQTDYSGRRTSPSAGELVRLPDNEVREADDEVREADTNHQEPPRTTNKATTKKRTPRSKGAITSIKGVAVPDRPEAADPQTWADWLGLRRAKNAPVTETVLNQAVAEATKAGLTLNRFLEIWCARGSQGLQADWLKPNERAGPAPRPSASANFRGKTYEGTPIEQLPPDLRAAARAAVGDS